MPYGLNIASSQAGTKNPEQVRNDNALSLLQQGQEINCPFHSPIGTKFCSHLPIASFGMAGSSKGRHPLSNYQLGKVSSKQGF